MDSVGLIYFKKVIQIQHFPWRGRNLRRGHFSTEMCAKMKELGTVVPEESNQFDYINLRLS